MEPRVRFSQEVKIKPIKKVSKCSELSMSLLKGKVDVWFDMLGIGTEPDVVHCFNSDHIQLFTDLDTHSVWIPTGERIIAADVLIQEKLQDVYIRCNMVQVPIQVRETNGKGYIILRILSLKGIATREIILHRDDPILKRSIGRTCPVLGPNNTFHRYSCINLSPESSIGEQIFEHEIQGQIIIWIDPSSFKIPDDDHNIEINALSAYIPVTMERKLPGLPGSKEKMSPKYPRSPSKKTSVEESAALSAKRREGAKHLAKSLFD